MDLLWWTAGLALVLLGAGIAVGRMLARTAREDARTGAVVHRDPHPTPGAFEPPVDLFREIARGGRALD